VVPYKKIADFDDDSMSDQRGVHVSRILSLDYMPSRENPSDHEVECDVLYIPVKYSTAQLREDCEALRYESPSIQLIAR
jgi:hypothetical protein